MKTTTRQSLWQFCSMLSAAAVVTAFPYVATTWQMTLLTLVCLTASFCGWWHIFFRRDEPVLYAPDKAGNYQLNACLYKTQFLCEADSYARNALHHEYCVQRRHFQPSEWSHKLSGMYTIGKRYGRPITLNVEFAEIKGVAVCFYYCDSELADWEVVTKWLKEFLPETPTRIRSDATNFHHIARLCVQPVAAGN